MKKANKKGTTSLVALFLAAAIWGFSFTAQSVGIKYINSFTFNCVRMYLGCAFLLIIIMISDFVIYKKSDKKKSFLDNYKDINILKGSIVCGILVCIASLFQQFGLYWTIVGKSSFVTSLYILFTPLLALFLGKKPTKKNFVCIFIALTGMYFLCINGSSSINKGDVLSFICAIFYAAHILAIDFYVNKVKPLYLSFGQFFVAATISGILALLFDKNPFANLSLGISPLLYSGILSCGIAYTLQIVGQKNAPTILATIIMSTESIFGLIGGFLILGQSITLKEGFGCVLMLIAVIFAQLSDSSKKQEILEA